MIFYTKLWDLLKERGMKKTDLLEVMSSPTLAKLGKNEIVTTEVIGKLCDFLDCQPNDIMVNVTKKDVETAEETINEALEQLVNMLAIQTGMDKNVLREQFMKQGQAMVDVLSEESNKE